MADKKKQKVPHHGPKKKDILPRTAHYSNKSGISTERRNDFDKETRGMEGAACLPDEVDMAEQLERELCWCIEQLELGMANKNPDSRQVVEAVKVLKVLKNSKAPLVKKRQMMRMTFGDYRKKMSAEEKQYAAKAKDISLSPADHSACKQSTFYKVACQKTVTTLQMGTSRRGVIGGDHDPSVGQFDKDIDSTELNMEENDDLSSTEIEQTLQDTSDCNFLGDDSRDMGSRTRSNDAIMHVNETANRDTTTVMSVSDAGRNSMEHTPKHPPGLNSEDGGQKSPSESCNFKFEKSDNAFKFSFQVTPE